MRNDKKSTDDENVILVVDSNMERSDKINALLKLHKQFGHSSQEKLLNLLKTKKTNKKNNIRNLIFTTPQTSLDKQCDWSRAIVGNQSEHARHTT